MVNLTFCRLDVFLIRSSLITPKHNIHLFPFISLQRDDHSCWNFFCWSSEHHLIRCFPNCFGFLWSSAVRISFSRRDHCFYWSEGEPVKTDEHGSWSDLLDALVSWWIFSNNRRRWFRSRPVIFLNFLGSFDFFGRFCLPLCLCIILIWNPIDYHIYRLFW